MAKALRGNELKLVLLLVSLAGLFYVAFQYFWIANFPIGTDALFHMSSVNELRAEGFWAFRQHSLYPFSIWVYSVEAKILEALFGYTLAFSFVFVVSLNLFITSLLTSVLAYRLFNRYEVAILASFLVATSRYMVDNLRMGVMAESFGWIFFLLSLIFFVGRRWIPMLISMVLLLFFHPMPFGIFCIYLIICLCYQLLTTSRRKYRLIYGGGLLTAIVVIYLLYRYDPMGNFQKAITILHDPSFNIPYRSFLVYMTENQIMAFWVYFFSFIGLFLLYWQKEAKTRLAIVLYLLGFIIAFKDYLGIHYISYRFYFYFEFIVAVVAAYGLCEMLKLAFGKVTSIMILLPVAFIIITPIANTNLSLTQWEITDYKRGNIVPEPDRKTADEIDSYIRPGSLVYCQSLWGRWLVLNNGVNVTYGAFQGYPNAYNFQPDFKTLKAAGFQYVYFSAAEPRIPAEDEDGSLLSIILDKDGVRLYEIK